MEFLHILRSKNEVLFFFGLGNFLLVGLFFLFNHFSSIEVAGTNAWWKPIKFALSIGIYSWTMAWLVAYLPQTNGTSIISWLIVISLGFEIIYIGIQAGRGQLSHFNISSPVYNFLYMMMAGAATLVSLISLWVAIRFFQLEFLELPEYYLWSIRLGLILFVIFSLEGFVMGANLSHSIGTKTTERSLPFLNWSLDHGDPRIAHFIGMHALQILPLLSFYLLKSTRLTFILSFIYAILAFWVLMMALQGRSPLKFL